jgi:hypothetical protein
MEGCMSYNYSPNTSETYKSTPKNVSRKKIYGDFARVYSWCMEKITASLKDFPDLSN